MRRAVLILSIVGILAALAWFRNAIACVWDPGPSPRFGRLHTHSPLESWELDSCQVEPGCFLDAATVREAYLREEEGNTEAALLLYRQVAKDAMSALQYRRADRFLLHPLDVARTRIRVAAAPKDEVLPFLAARRAYEEGRLDEARRLLREGGPLAEEWSCLAGLIELPTDAARAAERFAKWDSVRARWLLAQAQRSKGDHAAALATLEALRKRNDLDTLGDDVLAEIARCHLLAGRLTDAARSYEALLATFPDGDMREEAEESLLYVVYRQLQREGKELPPGIASYIEGTRHLSACGLAWWGYPEEALPLFQEALEKGPSWLRDNALYRVAMGSPPKQAAKRLRTLLKESPDGPFAPLAHYLLAMHEVHLVPTDANAAWGPHLAENPDRAPNPERQWDHLWAVCTRFPASQWAPAALTMLLDAAERQEREDEAIDAAAGVLRAQPPGGDIPYAAVAMRHLQRWVKDGLVSTVDLEKAGMLDRYLLETGQSAELMRRCPDSPFALRALVAELNLAEGSLDEGEEAAPLIEPAARVLDRLRGGDPQVVGFAHAQIARARLATGDAAGARKDAEEALALAPDAEWSVRAWDARGRADLALGKLEDAMAAAKAIEETLDDQADGSDLLSAFRAEVAVALERSGDRLGALRLYRDADYYADSMYVAEVICTTEELLAFHLERPADGTIGRVLWRRLLAEGRWDEARRVARAIGEDCHDDDSIDGRLELTDRLEQAWRQVEMCRGVADPSVAEEAVRRVRELGADDWEIREAAQQRLLEIGAPAARAIQAGSTANDAEVRERCTQLLERIPADPAVATYRWATTWFDLGQDIEGGWAGDVRLLRYAANEVSKEEGRAVEAFLEREHGFFRARRIYREVADRWPDDPTAAKALYMVGVVNLRLFDVAGLYGVVGSPEELAARAREAFIELAMRFPKSSLADDGLLWASYFSKGEDAALLRKRIVDEYPDGDVAHVVLQGGDWEAGLDPDRLAAFRAHNKALRHQGR